MYSYEHPNNPHLTVTVSYTTLFRVVLFLFGVVGLWFLRDVVVVIVAGLICSALINPIADWAQRRSIPRFATVIGVYGVAALVLFGVLSVLVPVITHETRGVTSHMQFVSAQVNAWGVQFGDIASQFGFVDAVDRFMVGVGQALDAVAAQSFGIARGLFSGMLSVMLVLVITYHLVVQKNALGAMIHVIVPEQHRGRVEKILTTAQERIGGWALGQATLALFIGGMSFLGLSLLGVESALVLAIVAGLTELVPYVGPILGAVPALVVALADNPLKALLVLALYILIQRIENDLLVPRIMHKAIGINPVFIIIGVLVGAKVGGIGGAILALPLIAALVAVHDSFQYEHREA